MDGMGECLGCAKKPQQELGERMTDEDSRYSKLRRAAAKGFPV